MKRKTTKAKAAKLECPSCRKARAIEFLDELGVASPEAQEAVAEIIAKKSDVLEQVAAELGMPFVKVKPAKVKPTDYKGLPKCVKKNDVAESFIDACQQIQLHEISHKIVTGNIFEALLDLKKLEEETNKVYAQVRDSLAEKLFKTVEKEYKTIKDQEITLRALMKGNEWLTDTHAFLKWCCKNQDYLLNSPRPK